MAIRKISEIIESHLETIENVSELPVRPNMAADTLQAAFDKNAKVIVDAIDDPNDGLIASIQDNISQAGGGDMSEAQYATGESPESSQYPVDRALYADKATTDSNGNNIATTYMKKVGGSANAINGDLYVTGNIVGGAANNFKSTTTAVTPTTGDWVTLESVALSAGTYIIVGTASYTSSSTSAIFLRINGAGSQYISRTSGICTGNTASRGGIQSVMLTVPSSTTTYTLDILCSSAYTVEASYLRAVRLG